MNGTPSRSDQQRVSVTVSGWEGDAPSERLDTAEDLIPYLEAGLRITRDSRSAKPAREALSNFVRLQHELEIDTPLIPNVVVRDWREAEAELIRVIAWLRSGGANEWSEPDSPGQWAIRFGMSANTFRRRCKAGHVVTKKITAQSVCVRRKDVRLYEGPDSHFRAKGHQIAPNRAMGESSSPAGQNSP